MSDKHSVVQRTERAINDNRESQATTAPASVAKQTEPELTARERWQVARPTKMMAFWLCLGVVVLTLAIGFTWGGWTTAAAAKQQATTSAQAAVVQRLGTICVAQFGVDARHVQNLAELQALGTSARSSFIRDGGWATMPGEDEADSKVVSECVKQVLAVASQ
jgi:hypothetical protein